MIQTVSIFRTVFNEISTHTHKVRRKVKGLDERFRSAILCAFPYKQKKVSPKNEASKVRSRSAYLTGPGFLIQQNTGGM